MVDTLGPPHSGGHTGTSTQWWTHWDLHIVLDTLEPPHSGGHSGGHTGHGFIQEFGIEGGLACLCEKKVTTPKLITVMWT